MSLAKTPPKSRWRGPLLVGLCFGLGYGITQRLLAVQWPGFVQLGQGFELRQFPGTSLESLRLRFGAEQQPQKLDLELNKLELEAKPPAPQSFAKPEGLLTPQAEIRSANLEGLSSGQAPPAPQLPPAPESAPLAPAPQP